nr:putative pentatricopeptide repeat-containing protein At3g15200 [Ipomoea batatas]
MLAETLSRGIQRCFRSKPISQNLFPLSTFIRHSHCSPDRNFEDFPENCRELAHTDRTPDPESTSSGATALEIQTILKLQANKSITGIHSSISERSFALTEELVLDVLKRHRSDWKPAYAFFSWVLEGGNRTGYSPGTGVYNEMLDILGKMRRFDELNQVLDVMSERGNLFSERTYGIVVNRYAAAHKIEEAIQFLYKRKEFGLEIDLIAFQTLLLSLCRYKHVEAAEFLYHNKKKEFRDEIKTRNIILNGWCVLGRLREAKRFWNDIVTSKCKPDKFTYGIFINSLCKAGKISTAVKLFQAMWEKGCKPDVAICNCIIDGLCFKKRIPEALEIFREMNERDCLPDTATYNSLIKHMCKIRRMEKVHELLGEMEETGEGCSPNARTYGYLIKSAKNPEEVSQILERMEKKGCKMIGDTCNLLLRLYMNWDLYERLKTTWDEMERCGLGPDQRSYTIMIHGLFEKGRLEDALHYFDEMTSKGMAPEPRTKLLVDAMNITLKDKGIGSEKVGTKNNAKKHTRN